MRNVSGIVRAAAVAVVAAGLAVGATRVSGSVQLAHPGRTRRPARVVQRARRRRLARVPRPAAPRRHRPARRRRAPSRSLQRPRTPGSSQARPASGSGSVQLLGGPSSTGLAQTADRGAVASAGVRAADVVVARASGVLAPGLVATQVWRHAGDDDRGLTVTPCQPPSSDVWLVGGGGGPSRTERIIVSNPGANAVSVSFEVLGTSGRIDAAADRGFSIPPLSREVVSLDAIAPDEAAPVVHVTATGGVVSAVLDDQWILGATGRGIDDATRAASPGTDLVVPGVETGGATSSASGQSRRHRGPGPGAAAHRQGCGAARRPPGRPRSRRLDPRRPAARQHGGPGPRHPLRPAPRRGGLGRAPCDHRGPDG